MPNSDTAFNLLALNSTISDEQSEMRFLHGRYILHRQQPCPCGQWMSLSVGMSASPSRWWCTKANCRKNVAVRSGTWCQGSKVPLRKIVQLLYAWSKGHTTCRFCVQDMDMAPSNGAWPYEQQRLRQCCATW
uniref:Uncharacterized protein n=1 Tax=Trichuris muris TaxID=70415 RepID=A0A5S6QMV3_TRIMR